MPNKTTRSSLCLYSLILVLSLFTITNPNTGLSTPNATANALELQTINMNQTADMKLAFLGIPIEYINQTQLTSLLPQTIKQFAYPNTITWALNFSFVFAPFPDNISDSLTESAFCLGSTAFLNITFLDNMLSQLPDLAIPECGYLLTFLSIPNATGHSWFYIQERPDLFLNRTDYFNDVPFKYWIFPPSFGGLRRALYFDISDTMQQSPTESSLTSTVSTLITNSLGDIFTSLGGSIDPRWIAADTQKYRDYNVRILWLNGTEGQTPINLDQIRASFEDLMPWTHWTATIKAEPADKLLNDLIQSRTLDLPTPLNYTILLPNGTQLTIQSQRNVYWNPYENSGENDPINQYFFKHVKEYFNLTDLDDKSVIPVILMQLDNDTAFGGSFQAGVSWFPYNVIIIAFQGSTLTDLGETGQIGLTHLLRHEIGHWVSLIHHSSDFASGYPKIICSMRSITNEFCAFCKDARARISFISYYNSTIELLTKNQTKATILKDQLNNALQSFYDWNYAEALNEIVTIYYELDTAPPDISNIMQTPSQNSVFPEDEVKVNATVTDDLSGVKLVILNYTNNNGTWNPIEMTNIEGNIWNATIPAFPYNTNVTYTITAEDNFNNIATIQETGQIYWYIVVPEFSPFTILLILMAAALLISIARIKKPSSKRQGKIVPRKTRLVFATDLILKSNLLYQSLTKPHWQAREE
jgi:hypothetical protein